MALAGFQPATPTFLSALRIAHPFLFDAAPFGAANPGCRRLSAGVAGRERSPLARSNRLKRLLKSAIKTFELPINHDERR